MERFFLARSWTPKPILAEKFSCFWTLYDQWCLLYLQLNGTVSITLAVSIIPFIISLVLISRSLCLALVSPHLSLSFNLSLSPISLSHFISFLLSLYLKQSSLHMKTTRPNKAIQATFRQVIDAKAEFALFNYLVMKIPSLSGEWVSYSRKTSPTTTDIPFIKLWWKRRPLNCLYTSYGGLSP